MDYLGGNGNGSRWFAAEDAAITNHPFYQAYSQQPLQSIDVPALKTIISESVPSADAAPILNYLLWVLEACKEIA